MPKGYRRRATGSRAAILRRVNDEEQQHRPGDFWKGLGCCTAVIVAFMLASFGDFATAGMVLGGLVLFIWLFGRGGNDSPDGPS